MSTKSRSDVARRRRAEASLRERRAEAVPERTEADTRRLLEELQVHEIELEMQNEELREANEAVELERERSTDLFDFAPVSYLTLNHEGVIQEANLTCANLLRVERSLLAKQRFGHFVSSADQAAFHQFMKKIFESKARDYCEVMLVKDGKSLFEARIEAGITASGHDCRVALTDITERKRAESDRLMLSKLESTGILAGGIAHDFNNLLTVILMNVEMARTLTGKELARHLEEANKATLLAQDLTRQMISFAKGDASARKAAPLGPVIQESVGLSLCGSRVRCEFALPDDLWPVEVDAGQFSQVIRNVVLNAVEAMSGGGVIVIRAANVALRSKEQSSLPPGDYVGVSITDEGEGISKKVLQKIFEPYFSTKQRGERKGIGLGLTICHSVVQQHGGDISVESVGGAGTTVHIRLPVSRKSIAPGESRQVKGPPRQGNILVMDDEEGVRIILAATLRRMGHVVELVEDGARAIEVYTRARALGRPFDMVMLDLTVRGGMGGQEAISALRQVDPAVKAIVMSGYATDPVVLDHVSHGFEGALAKPFSFGKLQEAVFRVMGS